MAQYRLWRQRSEIEREETPKLPHRLPNSEAEQLQILEHTLDAFVEYCERKKIHKNENAIATAKEKLYLARYGGVVVTDVVELVRLAMVLP